MRAQVVILLAAFLQHAGAQSADIDQAFQNFWNAKSPAEAANLADGILKTGVTFDEAWKRLSQGRPYKGHDSGVIQFKNRTEDGVEHYYTVNVPADYDPAKRYQLRFHLHGGLGGRTDNTPRGTGEIGSLAGVEQFYVLPYSWKDAPWWGDDQVLNLNAIVDALKRIYNVDENRVVLSGVSDGGTGAYFVAMRDTTPFASFLPLNAYIMVLREADISDGKIFPNNLRNKPIFVVNGGRDPLYPTSTTEPFTKHLMAGGVEISYHPQPEGEHDTRWWPQVKDDFEKFVAEHPRDPHPAKLTWEAADASHNRAHWLVLDEFGPALGEAEVLPDINHANATQFMFDNVKTGGRVDLTRTGNTVEVSSRNVTAFTLLLSPDKFDLSKPMRVMANGKKVFEGKVDRDLKTLLKWAARDNDRTMLYAAELKISLIGQKQ